MLVVLCYYHIWIIINLINYTIILHLKWISATFVLLAQLSMVIGCLRSSKVLHSKLLFGIFRSPVKFFDTTPLGRILNRFGKDIDVVDNVLPPNIKTWLFCLVLVCEIFSRSLKSTNIYHFIFLETASCITQKIIISKMVHQWVQSVTNLD